MALKSSKSTSNNNSNSSYSGGSYVEFKSSKSSKSITSRLTDILMWVPNRIIDLTCFMIRGRGRGLIGLGVFAWGLVISADSYWQAANPGAPALTQFGNPDGRTVLGLWTSLGLVLTSRRNAFLGAVLTSTIIQVIEGLAVRGSTPQEAKGTLDHYSQFEAGSSPSGKIKRAAAAHRDYVNAGMFQYWLLGFAAIGCWIADIVVTFQTHNPLTYWGNPITVLMVAAINVIKVFAAETGFVIMLRLNGRG